jgi:hypothetical protein
MAIMPNGIGTVARRFHLKLFSHQEISIAQNADVGPGGFVESRLPFLALCRGLRCVQRWCAASRDSSGNSKRHAMRCGASQMEVPALFFSSSFGSMKLVCCVSEAEEWSEVALVLT